jgi:hypothetical protein
MTITIQGIEFDLPSRYRPGHVLNEAEASALNSTLSERLRTNFSKRVIAAKANGLSVSKLRDEFAEYARLYEFTLTLDPLEALARKLALDAIAAKLRADDRALPEDEAWREAAISAALRRPYFREEAARRLASAREAASQVLDMDPLP